MPWTVKDVPRFTKKAKTPAQKRKWVKIANGVLRSCKAEGGSNCEGRAIRIANSKFSEERAMKEAKVPKGALRFIDHNCHAHVEFFEDGDKKIPKLKMVAYSGGIIKDHWYWNSLAIDLSGMQFKQPKFPVLEDHMTSRKIAVIGKPVIEDNQLKAPENAKFLSTEESEEFQRLSYEGFPYQSSIYAKPSNVERLEEGASAEVNGYTMKGPGSIWRKCEFKEMSICVFGADSKTRAEAFSREETENVTFSENTVPALAAGDIDNNIKGRKEVKKTMNKEELMEEHSDLVQEIVAEAVAKAEAKFSVERDDLTAQLTAEKTANAEMADRVQKLEKNDIIRREREHKSLAGSIWTRILAESTIPANLYEKVSRMVSYSKFVKDEVFDESAFSEAVTAEVKDWEDKGVSDVVIGSGFTEKEVDKPSKKEEEQLAEDQAVIDRLVKRSGVKVTQD